MASTSFTPNLGLCSWSSDDRPKRMDFVNDNALIDEILGAHLNNSNLHVSAEEKEIYSSPYKVISYAGDGQASKSINTGEGYAFAIIFQKFYPPVEVDASNNVISHFALVGRMFGSSANLTMTGTSITVTQDTVATDGVKNNFNEAEGQYVMILFR